MKLWPFCHPQPSSPQTFNFTSRSQQAGGVGSASSEGWVPVFIILWDLEGAQRPCLRWQGQSPGSWAASGRGRAQQPQQPHRLSLWLSESLRHGSSSGLIWGQAAVVGSQKPG